MEFSTLFVASLLLIFIICYNEKVYYLIVTLKNFIINVYHILIFIIYCIAKFIIYCIEEVIPLSSTLIKNRKLLFNTYSTDQLTLDKLSKYKVQSNQFNLNKINKVNDINIKIKQVYFN